MTMDSLQSRRQEKVDGIRITVSRIKRPDDTNFCNEQDFNDLFSTLMVSLPLTPHRVRFTRIEHTFTSEEAMTNLGSLKFSQSNRMPDPKDPSRIVTTTTTTTFSMAKEMARSVCQRFLDARFIESADGKSDFSSKSSVWQLTPKGMHILARFCQRNGIHQRHVNDLLDSPRNMMQLVILEREPETDKITSDAATVGVIFRRFAGDTGPNLKPSGSASDTDSVSDYATGLIGVKMQRSRRGDRESPYVFSGKSAFDWLMDCCTLVDKREVFELANLFITHGLVDLASEDRNNSQSGNARFAASKHVTYSVTQKGMRIAGWVTSPNGSVNADATAQQRLPSGVSRDSNTNRLAVIMRDPALRLLFREYLRETHCEENLAFFVEVKTFLAEYELAKRNSTPPKLDVIRETLASAYSLYNAFLAPGSPCELNIDHNLRNALAGRMTRAVGEDEQMVQSLDEVAVLFDQAQSSVFKLMASVSRTMYLSERSLADLEFAGFRSKVLEGAKVCQRPKGSQSRIYVCINVDKLIGRIDTSISPFDIHRCSESGCGFCWLSLNQYSSLRRQLIGRPDTRHRTASCQYYYTLHRPSILDESASIDDCIRGAFGWNQPASCIRFRTTIVLPTLHFSQYALRPAFGHGIHRIGSNQKEDTCCYY